MECIRSNKLLGLIVLVVIVQSFNIRAKSQGFQVSVGTDVPYQFYVGGAYGINSFEFFYKTGVLVSPYSDAILNITESMGADPVYSQLLHSAYRFGWMNTLGVSYRFGKSKTWYAGPEVRFDKLTASETSTELIEATSGEDVSTYRRPRQNEANIDLGVNLVGVGARLGKSFNLGESGKHSIQIEISASKYILSNASVSINGTTSNRLSTVLDDLLWEDVFKSYGFIGGIGISYQHAIGFSASGK